MTTSRVDYGLLRLTLLALRERADCELLLVVGGTHLDRRFGHTVDEILRDGLPIAARVPMPLRADSGGAAAGSMSHALQGFARAFEHLKPDIVLVLGDRYEMLAAACAAALVGCVIAHLHGGETTAGSLDEGWRHAITKIAHLHLATTREFAKRIKQMGESPKNIRVVGAPGVEALRVTSFLDRAALAKLLRAPLDGDIAIVTYHPVTNDPPATLREANAVVLGLRRSTLETIVLTGANADPGARAIDALFRDAASADRRFVLRASLGSQGYHSLMRVARVMVGNSSSVIPEAPSLGLPVVNVGSRQDGRPRAANVIDVKGDRDAIGRAIARARSSAFRARSRTVLNPYDGGRTSQRVARFLMTVRLTDDLRQKRFVDPRVGPRGRGGDTRTAVARRRR